MQVAGLLRGLPELAAQQPATPRPPRPSQTLATGPARHPTAPPASASAPAPVSGNFTSSGGTVYATCLSGQVKLVSWIPAQGYQTDGYATGPATSAWVKFKSSAAELTVTATCAGGQPQFATAADDRGGGGGGDGHGGGGGPGPGGG